MAGDEEGCKKNDKKGDGPIDRDGRGMLLKKEDLWQRIAARQIDPVYLFYGDEEFLLQEAINKIKLLLQPPDPKKLRYHFLYSDEVSLEKLIELALTLPFGKPTRLISYRLTQKPKGSSDKELLSSYFKRPANDTVIVFIADETDFSTGFFKLLKEKAITVRFYPLFENQIPEWIKRQAAQMDIKISSDAALLMKELVGTDLGLLVNELHKMSIYVQPRKTINTKDVEEVVGKSRVFSVFELTRSLGEKNLGQSLTILQQLFDTGQSPVGLIALIAHHFRRLLQTKLLTKAGKESSEIARSLSISPFFLKEYIAQTRLFSSEEIEGFFQLFLQVDLQLKSSSLSNTLILEALILKICGHPEDLNASSIF
jgi:DNA polymerase-3 subunit delta